MAQFLFGFVLILVAVFTGTTSSFMLNSLGVASYRFVTTRELISSIPKNRLAIQCLVSTRGGAAADKSLSTGITSTSRFSSSSDQSEVSESDRRTGWTHSKPNKLRKDTIEEDTTELRTGWLHNKKSLSSKEEVVDQKGDKKPTESKAQKLLRLAKKKEMTNHRILSSPTFHACGDDRQAVITEHRIDVALKHDDDAVSSPMLSQKISVYFTIVQEVSSEEDELFFKSLRFNDGNDKNVERKRADLYVQHAKMKDANDAIIYMQGGPGFGAPTPISGIGLSDGSSWVGVALSKGFKRVVLMDQRGTGRSTPITKQTLEIQFPDLFALDNTSSSKSSFGRVADELDAFKGGDHADLMAKAGTGIDQATEYIANFRADSIVKDAELVKEALLMPEANDEPKTPKPWGAALGQSFGGFCLMTYLSQIPNPPKICLFTGGVAPMLTPVDEVYEATWERVKKRNLLYYERYPGDIPLVKYIVQRLITNPPKLPSGGTLTARRFLQLGIGFGSSPSSFASIHSFLNSAFVSDNNSDTFNRSFLKQFDTTQSWDDNPIYFLLHESIYADGKKHSNPTEWSAHRVLENKIKQPNNEFDYEYTLTQGDDIPTMFYGEMIFPWMADGDYAELSGFGMRALAQALADKDDWGELYDSNHMRKVFNSGITKAAAAVYYDDMYVDFDLTMKLNSIGGPLEKCKVWVTNDYQHSGLRDDGATIFKKILGMAKGSVGTPS